eukprot:m.125667 g.125667  ORF g.125667 m.125667 type:complete len:106 (+) comp37877_c0_seq54:2215-2532(+)
MLHYFANQGDVQMSVTMILALGDKLNKGSVEETTLEQWFLSYIGKGGLVRRAFPLKPFGSRITTTVSVVFNSSFSDQSLSSRKCQRPQLGTVLINASLCWGLPYP